VNSLTGVRLAKPHRRARLAVPLIALLLSGCGITDPGASSPSAPGPGGIDDIAAIGADEFLTLDNDVVDGIVEAGDDSASSAATVGGPFADAVGVSLVDEVAEIIEGTIPPGAVVDVYDVGPILAGDRLVVTADAVGSLDPVLGIFDASGDAMIINDDRNYYGGNYNAAIDFQSRRNTVACYVALAASHGSGTSGDYVLSVRRASGAAAPAPRPQAVYLNFEGAQAIVIGQRAPIEIPRFEGSLIGVEFSGRSDELIEQIAARVRLDYAGLDVDIVSSREGPPPSTPYTTLHFGAYDPGLLGLADYVDEFNEVVAQKAVIFVDTFQAFLPLNPSLEEMAHALANVASHEAGHLLGLNHAADPRAIMDVTANLRQMLADQVFLRSPLHPEVFPAGHQDAARLLVEAVGGDLEAVRAAAARQRVTRAAWYDKGERIPARLNHPFSCCGCGSCVKHRLRRERGGQLGAVTGRRQASPDVRR
jgi:hypothetical protein